MYEILLQVLMLFQSPQKIKQEVKNCGGTKSCNSANTSDTKATTKNNMFSNMIQYFFAKLE
jgi:hypothetical protein